MTPVLLHSLMERKKNHIETLLSLTVVGNYHLKFILNNPDVSTGELIITHSHGAVVQGLVEVYLTGDDVYTALYSSKNVLIFEQPSTNFLNILKLFLLAKP